jgi:alpha-tubulin suppressor-like RCC1 family protein/serine/threonine protein kinase
MNSEATRERILELFEAALLEAPAQRPDFLRSACGDREKLLAEVTSLVAAYERLGDTSQPALQPASDRAEAGAPSGLGHVGRYEIGRELGRGGMGIVFEARDPLIGRTVALKTIRFEGYRTPAERDWLRDHLFREARSAGALSHANIVTIHDSGVEGDLAFIAMERLDGPTLQQRLAAGERLHREEALGILRQAAAGLDYAHQAGIVHRDIKPSNIMFHRGTTVKITDFGIAKIAGAEPPTRTGMPAGTPNYMSPEQIQGHAVDGRSDQFSLSVVAFEMLTGRQPFRAESIATVVHQIVYEERPSARAVVAELPAAVDGVFRRAFAKGSPDRYETCAEFVSALEAAFTTPARRVERWRWLWVGLAAATLLLMAWFATQYLWHRPLHQAVLHRDFDKLGLRTEAYLDNRPGWPHRDDVTWRYVPAQVSRLSSVVGMAGGWEHSLALTSDGSLWAWGNGSGGQLGDGTTNTRPTPIRIGSRGGAGFVALAAGEHSMALKNDGSVWAWGGNEYSELGDGTATNRWTPVQVRELSGAVAIAVGSWHSLALKNDGTVWAWGGNDHMQLGDGTNRNRRAPARVSALSSMAAISGGMYHSLALGRDGTVWAWGSNANGRLGDGTTTDRGTPVRVSGISSALAIAAGAHHSLALTTGGAVWAWGQNGFGELGDGTTADRWTPVRVTGLTSVTAIAAGANHSFALKNDGTVWAWGQNDYGALGDGTTTNRQTPVQAKGLSGVVAIAAGGQHCLARKRDGSLWTWGGNDSGQLGRESTRALDHTGTAYIMANGDSPWVKFDKNRHKVFLHPGKSSTYQWAASVGFDMAADASHTISGTFQRASTSLGIGNAVVVAVIVGTDADHPLWELGIGAHDGSPKTFTVRKRLLRGQALRFVVFSGEEGRDASADGTSLEATIRW